MDGQEHTEVPIPMVEDEQSAVAAEAVAELANSTGEADPGEGGQQEEETQSVDDELIEKAQKLMEKITSAANNPNPNILHNLSHLLESQESLYVPFLAQLSVSLLDFVFIFVLVFSLTLTCIRRFLEENGYYSNARGSHTSGKLCNLIRVSLFKDCSFFLFLGGFFLLIGYLILAGK